MIARDPAPSLIIFYAVAFGFAWAFWVPLALHETGILTLSDAAYAFLNDSNPAAWGPLIAALIVVTAAGGRVGLTDFLGRMVRVRFSISWYLVCLFLVPLIVLGAGVIAVYRGADTPISDVWSQPGVLPVAFLWIFFLGGPLQEEAGWRGVASDQLEKNGLGALGASLVAGFFWGIWHLPLFFVPRAEIYYNQPIWGLVGSTMLLSVLLTWVYNNTGRSIFAVMLMHTSFNWSNYAFTTLQSDLGGQTYFVLMILMVTGVTLMFGPSRLVK